MKQIYTKTMRFQLMKLLPGLASLVCSVLLLIPVAIWCGHGLEGFGKGIVMLVWAGLSVLGYYLTVYYYGYLFRTAFMAAAAEYAVNQALPTSYRDFVREFVQKQFKKPADFLYLFRLTGQSLKELSQGASWMDQVTLHYLTMCCVCINFYKKKAGKYKAMADAVVLFSKNQKKLMKQSRKLVMIVLVSVIAATLLFWMMLVAVPALNAFSAFVFAVLITLAFKNAFLDSWFLMKELLVFGGMEQMGAEQAYDELSAKSRAFRKLYHKVRREQSALDVRPTEFDFHSMKFCGECGALVAPETDGKEKEAEQSETVEQEEETVEERDSQIGENFVEAEKTIEKDGGMVRAEENGSGETAECEADAESGQTNGFDDQENRENGDAFPQAGVQGDSEYCEKVRFCGECGAAVFTEELFCGECGAALTEKNVPLFCGECGAKVGPEEKFCGECGTKIE